MNTKIRLARQLRYRESVIRQDPVQRNTPASHGALRSSHCIAPDHGNEGILFHRAAIATVTINAIFDTTIVTPTATSMKTGARNHRKGSRRPSSMSLRRGESICVPRRRSSASKARVLRTVKGDISGPWIDASHIDAIEMKINSIGKLSRITSNKPSLKLTK